MIRRGDGIRYEVSAPVLVRFVPSTMGDEVSDETAPAICVPLVQAGPIEGTVVDVSERGMQLHIVGLAAKALLDQDITVRNARLEVRFTARELHGSKPCMARARWSRSWLERGILVIGVRFDLPLGSEVLQRIVPQASDPAGIAFPWRSIAGAVAVCAMIVVGFQGYKVQASSHAALTARVTAQEEETSEVRTQLQECQSAATARTLSEVPVRPVMAVRAMSDGGAPARAVDGAHSSNPNRL